MQDWTINSDPTFLFCFYPINFTWGSPEHQIFAWRPGSSKFTYLYTRAAPKVPDLVTHLQVLKLKSLSKYFPLGCTHYSQRSFDCWKHSWKTLLGMDYSQTIDFCIIYPRDSNQVLFIVSFSAWEIAEKDTKRNVGIIWSPTKRRKVVFGRKEKCSKNIRPSQTLAVMLNLQ